MSNQISNKIFEQGQDLILGQKRSLVLGIETSCDETAASIIARYEDENGNIKAKIKSNIVRSQIDEHAPFGGVVPELAARSHVVHLDIIIAKALKEAKLCFADIDAIGATAGPGLIGGVLVGLTTAKALCAALDKPFLAINHLEAHALTARLTDNVQFPYLMLLVSGGHSQYIEVNNIGDYKLLGTTIDDALGEAFDKTAKMLGLTYPGGPEVEKAAKNGDANRFKFPKPLLHEKRLDFSFSGLKTAVRLAAQKIAPLNEQDKNDICASFQKTVVDILCARTKDALEAFKQTHSDKPLQLVIAGGVAANKAISLGLEKIANEANASLIVPPISLCTDNGAMVAWAAAERYALGVQNNFDFAARPRWPLDDESMRI